MMDRLGRPWRTAALVSVIAVAFGAVACGDDSEDGSESGGAKANAPAPSTDAGPVSLGATQSGSDKAQVEATLRYMRLRFNAAADEKRAGADYCAKLTAARQKEMLTSAFVRAKSCPEATEEFSRLGRRTGHQQLPIKIYSVKVAGDKAVVRMKGGVAGSHVYDVQLVTDGGEWKLPSGAIRPL